MGLRIKKYVINFKIHEYAENSPIISLVRHRENPHMLDSFDY